ncbi:unnamed protein product [Oppiella nova]|uniref:Uncharacterized protein n=1 Tax=Oppiella nova TaxID=334625 RepID=A0A7R9QKC8_9ACAR|nr:unnamed protein product [Oppiella nova]CAG2167681.1 unnamed protein product [Oppiella nova]
MGLNTRSDTESDHSAVPEADHSEDPEADHSADPDIKLCKDMKLDGAFSADDGLDYVFRGDYFWRFDTDIAAITDEFAQSFIERWPQLPTPINTGFVIDEEIHRKSTVFLNGRDWFLYKDNKRVSSGSTQNWPQFPSEPIHTAFTYINQTKQLKDTTVVLIYSQSKYIKYIIQDIEQPVLVEKGNTTIVNYFLYFLIEGSDHFKDRATRRMQTVFDLNTLRDIVGAVANHKHLVLFDGSMYCTANISEKAPGCVSHNVTEDTFKCPRSARPTTTTTTIAEPSTQNTSNAHLIQVFDDNSRKPQKKKSQAIAIHVFVYYLALDYKSIHIEGLVPKYWFRGCDLILLCAQCIGPQIESHLVLQ